MSFGFLPWPLYVLMILISITICFVWLIETWREHPKVLIFGFALAGIGGIMAGICKVIEETGFLRSEFTLLSGLTGLCSVLGAVLISFGCYIEVKDDPYKRKSLVKIALITGAGLVLCGLGLAYLELQEAGLLWL